MAISTTSIYNTPQANDDWYSSDSTGLTEDNLITLSLDVMSDDLGGKAKTLYSLDNGDSITDLTQFDGAMAESASSDYSQLGAHIWIANGKVQYDASTIGSSINALAVGESTWDSFTYAIRLGNGTLAWATTYVEIMGVNDAVVIGSAAQAATINEDTDDNPLENNETHSASGAITYTDADTSDTHAASAVAQGLGYLGTFTIDTSTIDTGNGGTVGWNFAIDDSVMDSLSVNDTLVQSYDVTIDDGNGGAVIETVSVTLQGTNDGPVITSDAAAATGTVDEDGEDAPITASGQLTASDVDHDATASWSIVGSADGTYGSIIVDESGLWTYTLNNDDPAVQALV